VLVQRGAEAAREVEAQRRIDDAADALEAGAEGMGDGDAGAVVLEIEREPGRQGHAPRHLPYDALARHRLHHAGLHRDPSIPDPLVDVDDAPHVAGDGAMVVEQEMNAGPPSLVRRVGRREQEVGDVATADAVDAHTSPQGDHGFGPRPSTGTISAASGSRSCRSRLDPISRRGGDAQRSLRRKWQEYPSGCFCR
jgi:hypothetical protein